MIKLGCIWWSSRCIVSELVFRFLKIIKGGVINGSLLLETNIGWDLMPEIIHWNWCYRPSLRNRYISHELTVLRQRICRRCRVGLVCSVVLDLLMPALLSLVVLMYLLLVVEVIFCSGHRECSLTLWGVQPILHRHLILPLCHLRSSQVVPINCSLEFLFWQPIEQLTRQNRFHIMLENHLSVLRLRVQ
jgi:hypothetical protein